MIWYTIKAISLLAGSNRLFVPLMDIFTQLNNGADAQILLKDYSVDFDESTFMLTLRATVEYIGYSVDGNFDHDPNLGMNPCNVLVIFMEEYVSNWKRYPVLDGLAIVWWSLWCH